MDVSQALVSLGVGLGLSAACGFRVFLPFLALSIAARTGAVTLAGDFAWIASTPALVALGVATVVEIVAYFVPWLDHALDVIATPTALAAGVLATAAVFADVSPLVRWGAALIGGGGAAGLVQGVTVAARMKSAALSGGLTNPFVSSLELGGATFTSLFSILIPAFIIFMIVLLVAALFWLRRRAISAGPHPPS